jgi:hypothetical protein
VKEEVVWRLVAQRWQLGLREALLRMTGCCVPGVMMRRRRRWVAAGRGWVRAEHLYSRRKAHHVCYT